MLLEKSHVKLILNILLSILGIIVVVLSIFLLEYVSQGKGNPIQKEKVTVIKKDRQREYRRNFFRYIITFQFPDGSKKEFEIPNSAAKILDENDTGIITFQKKENDTKWTHRYFRNFEIVNSSNKNNIGVITSPEIINSEKRVQATMKVLLVISLIISLITLCLFIYYKKKEWKDLS